MIITIILTTILSVAAYESKNIIIPILAILLGIATTQYVIAICPMITYAYKKYVS